MSPLTSLSILYLLLSLEHSALNYLFEFLFLFLSFPSKLRISPPLHLHSSANPTLLPNPTLVSLPSFKFPRLTPFAAFCSCIPQWSHTTWSRLMSCLGWFLDHFMDASLVPSEVQSLCLPLQDPFSTRRYGKLSRSQ